MEVASDICGIFHISNLMYPVWLPVLCNESVKADVLCMNPYGTDNNHLLMRHTRCEEKYILFNEKCYYVTGLSKENVESIEHVSKTDQEFLSIVLKYFSNVAFVNIMFCFRVECYQFDSLTKIFVPHHTNFTDQENIKLNVLKGKLKILCLKQAIEKCNYTNAKVENMFPKNSIMMVIQIVQVKMMNQD